MLHLFTRHDTNKISRDAGLADGAASVRTLRRLRGSEHRRVHHQDESCGRRYSVRAAVETGLSNLVRLETHLAGNWKALPSAMLGHAARA
jgi:hypothetical protein